ncbi:putative bifunctional diguanylate cyclase/phosphodiesterase [Nakamurella sp. GG22]
MTTSDVPLAAPTLPDGDAPYPQPSGTVLPNRGTSGLPLTGTEANRIGPGDAAARSRWRRPQVIVAAIFVAAVAVSGYLVSYIAGPDSLEAAWVNNLAQLVMAVFATVAAAMVVRRHTRSHRRAWLLVTIACGFWAIGQLYWCYVELVQAVEVPDVSAADFFFLAFTAVMAVAVWPSDGRHTDQIRTLLDAFIIGSSLFVISWVTSVGALAEAANGTDRLATFINLAYPCGDVVVLTMVILGASRRVGDGRSSLAAVAAAMALIAVSDGFYAFESASGNFAAGSITTLGWTVGFGLIACAAVAGRDRPSPDEHVRSMLTATGGDDFPERSRRASSLPYVPLAIALVVVGVARVQMGVDRVAGVLLILTFIGVLLRQYLTIRDNQALTRHLENRERELQRQAFADQLTGLPNRALFTDRVTHALDLHRRSLRPLALLFIDLDDFKAVNDTLGHPVGDELVIRVAERLRGAMRTSDTVARFGGDEFAVLIEGDLDAVTVGARIVEALGTPFTLRRDELSIGASIGIAEVQDSQLTPTLDELFSRADIAMYAAKRAGKGQLAIYDPSMVLPEAADLHYRPLLIEAMKSGAIECVYQPIIDLRTGRVHSVEALARWRVGGETVPQDYFIKLAGRLGLLPDLTDLMLNRACAQLADWSLRCLRPDLRIGVNAPPGLMTDRDFPRRVATILRRHGLGPDRLILEITEDALLGETALAQQVAERFRRMGVQLWLDDFGTGYSSLLSLRQMSLQAVKIDIAFVANIHTDPSAERFLRALLALGRDLDLLVTAEGVELVEQADILRQLGCQLVQGFLYARPAPAAELDALIAHGTQAPMGRLEPDGRRAHDVALDNDVANGTPGLPLRAARE